MKMRNLIIVVAVVLAGLGFSNKAKAQTLPLIGIDYVSGIQDTMYIGYTYDILAVVKNYNINTTYSGPIAVLLNTENQQQAGFTLYIDGNALFTPNVDSIFIDTTFYMNPAYFVLGGGITTVVVWPQVDAPTTDPFIQQILILDPLSTAENRLDNNVDLYPNPAGDKIVVALNGAKTTLERVRIFNLSGQIVADELNADNAVQHMQFNLTNLTQGIYIMEAQTPQGMVRKKFVKL